MQQIIQKWGNSLAIRIPKNLAIDTKIDKGSLVEISINEGKLIVEPLQDKQYSLEQLLSQITDENKHSETNTGPASGNEIW